MTSSGVSISTRKPTVCLPRKKIILFLTKLHQGIGEPPVNRGPQVSEVSALGPAFGAGLAEEKQHGLWLCDEVLEEPVPWHCRTCLGGHLLVLRVSLFSDSARRTEGKIKNGFYHQKFRHHATHLSCFKIAAASLLR